MKNTCAFVFIFLFATILIGQENPSMVTKDFRIWSALDFQLDLGKKYEFSLKQALRTKNNSQEVKNYFSELSLSKEVIDDVKYTVRARFINVGNNTEYRLTNHLDYKYRLKPIDISLRTRYDLNFGDDDKWRNRISLTYRKKKLDWRPSVGIEFSNSSAFDFSLITRVRTFVKLRYKVNKLVNATAGYILQEDFNVNRPDRDYILNFALGIDLGKIRKSKKEKKGI